MLSYEKHGEMISEKCPDLSSLTDSQRFWLKCYLNQIEEAWDIDEVYFSLRYAEKIQEKECSLKF